MANQEHLDLLKQGMEVWNQWREENPDIQPDFSEADLSGMDLQGIAYFFVSGQMASMVPTNLAEANFYRANLHRTNLSRVDLTNAYLRIANLTNADLSESLLSNTILSDTNLAGTNFRRTYLRGAIFLDSKMNGTLFNTVDLSDARRLDTAEHLGPSIIGIDTIYLSRGNIPEIFLRKAGVPEPFITNMRALVGAMSPIEFYSCFISYSRKDHSFAESLYADLQSKGVRCWFAPEDLKIGAKIRSSIDESIRRYDKLLLVLSQHSVKSQWIEQEVETALEKERREHHTVLFPIRLDNTVMINEGGWPALIRNTRNIGDFTRWEQHDAYQKALDRLLRDLKAEA